MTPKQVADYLIQNRHVTRTRRGNACPVCHHTDWCLSLNDGSAALCRRADGTGSIGKYGEYGYLYVFSSGSLSSSIYLPSTVKRPEKTDQELDAIWRPRVEWWYEKDRSGVGMLSGILGVSISALRELRVGWDGKCWTFPERNETGLIVGINRRFRDGGKRCAVGSRRGLTYSDSWQEPLGPVLIVEGGSDVAAGITLGLAVIGRPSNTGGLEMLAKLLRDTQRKIVVIGERDRKPDGRWPGMEGAKSIASGLRRALSRSVGAKLLPDNAKDLRDFLNRSSASGRTYEESRERLIENA